ncbi:unnamed protein product [Clonostachys rosea]|uniref:Phospholipase A2 n=1 Tax=Bionectria ochroleuca TaxID=29856 RepID=A0ABY6U2S0_BIOOC|nr:unnamed protein product [Clonostachys rosea]
MKLIIIALFLVALALAGPVDKKKLKKDIARTDDLMFRTNLADFISKREGQQPPTLDWNSDGCTGVPDKPLEFNFLPACYRHDFGYANFKHQGRFNEVARLKIDEAFKDDLNTMCDKEKKHRRVLCRTYASGYHMGARLLGDLNAKLAPRDSSQALASIPLETRGDTGIRWEHVKAAVDKLEVSKDTYEAFKNRLEGPAKKFIEDLEAQVGKPNPTFQDIKDKLNSRVTVMGMKKPVEDLPAETNAWEEPKKDAKKEPKKEPKKDAKKDSKKGAKEYPQPDGGVWNCC